MGERNTVARLELVPAEHGDFEIMEASNNSNVGENWGVIVNFYVPCVKPKESFRIKKA